MQKRTPATQAFTVVSTFREAGKLIGGSKWPILAPVLIFLILSSALFIFFGFIFNHMHLTDTSSHSLWALAYTVASLFLLLVFSLWLCAMSGVFKVAIQRARTHHIVQAKVGFQGLSRFTPVMITAIVMIIFFMLPLFFIAVPLMIYILYFLVIGVFFSLSLPLAVDKTNSPLVALVQSAKITSRHFFSILGIFIVLSLMFLILCIPLGLGLFSHSHMVTIVGGIILFFAMIGFIPLKYLTIGVIYHKLIYKGDVNEQRTARFRNAT